MDSPTFDAQGYPTDETLKAIETWDANAPHDLLHFVKAAWEYGESYFRMKVRPKGIWFRLSTGGWSGNESLIDALENNVFFWARYWQESKRGGHYLFIVPKEPL